MMGEGVNLTGGGVLTSLSEEWEIGGYEKLSLKALPRLCERDHKQLDTMRYHRNVLVIVHYEYS